MPVLASTIASLLAPYAWDVVENQILPRLPEAIGAIVGQVLPGDEPSEEEEEE